MLAAKEQGGTRIDMIESVAEALGVEHIGIAHCTGFDDEAEALAERLRARFDVTTVDCRAGGELTADDLLDNGGGGICNGAGQAKVLADAGTGLNIELGLCLGTDLVFQKHSTAPVTVLHIKDRATEHRPLTALD
jgi:uncharacterized metal-binding protein